MVAKRGLLRKETLASLKGDVKFYEDDEEANRLSTDLFSRLDINSNGSLDRRELGRARSVLLGATIQGSDDLVSAVTALLSESDADQDGRVTLPEWIDFSRSVYEISGRKRFVNVTREWASTLRPATQKEWDQKPSRASAKQPSKPMTAPARTREPPPKAAPAAQAPSTEDVDAVLAEAFGSPAEAVLAEAFGSPADDASPEGSSGLDQHHFGRAKTEPGPRGEKLERDPQRAATIIQSVHRGKRGREKAATKKAAASSKKASTVMTLTSLVDLWETLTNIHGHLTTTVEVIDVVDLFAECKRTGLNPTLAETIPMASVRHDKPPEDLSPGEVAHLCAKLIEAKGELSAEMARQEIDGIKDEMRRTDVSGFYTERDAAITWKQFKQLMNILSVLMRVDKTYILTHMAWNKGSFFEMSDNFVGHVIEKCSHRRLRRIAGKERPSTAPADGKHPEPIQTIDISEEKFDFNAFRLLCNNCHVVQQKGRHGISYEEMGLLFDRVARRMPELIQQRQERRKTGAAEIKRSSSAKAAARSTTRSAMAASVQEERGDELYFIGRTEFSILMEELYKEEHLTQEYKSPLMMLTAFVQKAEEALEEQQKSIAEEVKEIQDAASTKRGKGHWT